MIIFKAGLLRDSYALSQLTEQSYWLVDHDKI